MKKAHHLAALVSAAFLGIVPSIDALPLPTTFVSFGAFHEQVCQTGTITGTIQEDCPGFNASRQFVRSSSGINPHLEAEVRSAWGFEEGSLGEVVAVFTYFVDVTRFGVPPIDVSSMPVIITARDQASGERSGDDSIIEVHTRTDFSGAGLGVTTDASFDHGSAFNNFADTGVRTFHQDMDIDGIATVRLSVRCDAGGSGGAGSGKAAGTAHCFGLADPLIEFDQSALDARLGSNTFRLADFFAFEFSPGIADGGGGGGNAVPEPSTLLLLAAVAALALARSGHKQLRRTPELWQALGAARVRVWHLMSR